MCAPVFDPRNDGEKKLWKRSPDAREASGQSLSRRVGGYVLACFEIASHGLFLLFVVLRESGAAGIARSAGVPLHKSRADRRRTARANCARHGAIASGQHGPPSALTAARLSA